MAQIIYTIDEYIVKERKRDTYWLVFNTVYNDVHAFKKSYKEMKMILQVIYEKNLQIMKQEKSP